MWVVKAPIPAEITNQMVNITLAGAGGNTVAIGGAVSLNFVRPSVDAHISNNSIVTASNNISVTAHDASTASAVAGSGGGAGQVAIGASVAVNDIRAKLKAFVDDAIVTSQNGAIEISADETAQAVNLAIGGQGAGTVAIMGSIAVNIVKDTVDAHIGNNAVVTAAQDILVSAMDHTAMFELSGNGGGAGTVAVGVSVAVSDIKNVVTAIDPAKRLVTLKGEGGNQFGQLAGGAQGVAGEAADHRGLLALERALPGVVGDGDTAQIGDVLAQGELAVQVQRVGADVAVVLLHQLLRGGGPCEDRGPDGNHGTSVRPLGLQHPLVGIDDTRTAIGQR